jgi:4-amino-4-deoxy-L-arabinose transferase-like glycosyltransferase
VLLNGRRAMQEGLLLLCSALVVWVAYRALRAEGRDGPPTGWLLGLGVAAGLALAAKHSAALVVAAALLALLVAPWLRPGSARPALRTRLAALAGVGVSALAVFSLLAPVWWSLPRTLALVGLAALAFGLRDAWRARPARRLVAAALVLVAGALLARPQLPADSRALFSGLLEARRSLLERQVERFAGPDSAGRRMTRLLHEAIVADPQYFEDPAWARFPEIQAEIDAYERSPWDGRRGGLAWGLPLAALCATGVAAAWRRRRDPAVVLLAAWLALPALALLANPLPWQRYYLGLHAPLAVLAALGAASWLEVASASLRSRIRMPKRVPGRSGSSPISTPGR